MHPMHCPHCGAVAMRYRDKASLGPMASRGCQACGRALSVRWSALVALMPAMFAIPFAVEMWPSNAAMLLAAIGVGATLALHARVPLVAR
ncbi:hypothetical protein DWG18_03825 [Lysobacter sp. TY2-98]|uniref:hypothetical protein n=1 Tax=Lysobacter sp. TY2-98 TaxID=2290922 RepID=UPI000E2063BF|nr:hypothetical protein [Lysobacter sp. TY2-98]AXK71507.1 hypothetical protein DWG18_03825 [Lysobacter sp. TY2-98]